MFFDYCTEITITISETGEPPPADFQPSSKEPPAVTPIPGEPKVTMVTITPLVGKPVVEKCVWRIKFHFTKSLVVFKVSSISQIDN